MPIKILSEEVASQIAAGEVIERPASVVKELVENSIDAGSTRIDVNIQEAGKALIEVSDNGVGIPPDEVSIALSRHSTSKISSADDLFHISTLGFRGEALASIASVSRMQITSCSVDETYGVTVFADSGKISNIQKVGNPVGTVISVEGLFYNVPARLKFLKTDSTEKRHISNLLTKFGLAYPNIRFQLKQDGKLVFSTSGNGDRREILSSIYDIDISRQLLEISYHENKIYTSGFISPLNITRSNRREIIFYVNGRWVQDISLSTAVIQAYKNMIMVGRYPIVLIFIEIDPTLVDVNVHPTKAEVRFSEPNVMFSNVQRAVKRGLLSYGDIPRFTENVWHINTQKTNILDRDIGVNDAPNDQEKGDEGHTAEGNGQESTAFSDRQPTDSSIPFNIPILRAVGQIGATYIVAEGPDGLYLIDQHAAHERILFEKILNERGEKIASQDLLEGEVIHLSPQDAQILEERIELLNDVGFNIENFGQNAFIIRAVPAFIKSSNPKAVIISAIEDIEAEKSPLETDMEEKIIAGICKKIAIKGGQILSDSEQKALIRDLEACQAPRTCPHGRPTMIHLSVDLLERQFGRKGSR